MKITEQGEFGVRGIAQRQLGEQHGLGCAGSGAVGAFEHAHLPAAARQCQGRGAAGNAGADHQRAALVCARVHCDMPGCAARYRRHGWDHHRAPYPVRGRARHAWYADIQQQQNL